MVDVGRGPAGAWREWAIRFGARTGDFIDAVQGQENRIRCPYAEAVATHRLALAIGESARTGQAIALETADV